MSSTGSNLLWLEHHPGPLGIMQWYGSRIAKLPSDVGGNLRQRFDGSGDAGRYSDKMEG
jgi:hypothetical protein